jgi:hypothetical protein
MIITLVFEYKRQFFRRKLAKIAENCDIDSRLVNFRLLIVNFGFFCKSLLQQTNFWGYSFPQ